MKLPYQGQISIWMVIGGSASLAADQGYDRRFKSGETVLIPATAGILHWSCHEEKPATLLGVGFP
jgi:hypothetical protein